MTRACVSVHLPVQDCAWPAGQRPVAERPQPGSEPALHSGCLWLCAQWRAHILWQPQVGPLWHLLPRGAWCQGSACQDVRIEVLALIARHPGVWDAH